MSLFSNILEKLGLKHPAAAPAPAKPIAAVPPPATQVSSTTPPAPQPGPGARPAPQIPKTPPPSPQAGAAPRPAPQVSQAAPPPREFEHGSGIPRPVPATPATPAEIPMVDVVSKLDRLAAENPQKLNWKVSIVDMLKLLDIDSSYEARKELAVELGCPTDKMGDSAQMNTWLHKTVMQKLAENGGNIPKELLD